MNNTKSIQTFVDSIKLLPRGPPQRKAVSSSSVSEDVLREMRLKKLEEMLSSRMSN